MPTSFLGLFLFSTALSLAATFAVRTGLALTRHARTLVRASRRDG